jgi:ribose 5-phosphate isomerase A
MNADTYKREAAAGALDFVKPGMRLGLGTGSTAKPFVEMLGERVRAGLDVIAVPTSEATRTLAEQCGIRLTTLDETPELDLTVDGADEIAPDLTLIKGGGGALLREKIVACASDRVVIIADGAKAVDTLGAFALPVEVIPFGWEATRRLVEELLEGLDVGGREAELRMRGGAPFVTDEGNRILDLRLGRIGDARKLSMALNQIPGVVENGLFLDICDTLVLGYEDERVEVQGLGAAATEGVVPFRGQDNVFTDLVD